MLKSIFHQWLLPDPIKSAVGSLPLSGKPPHEQCATAERPNVIANVRTAYFN